MPDLFTRTYSFIDGTIAYGSRVEYEIGNIVTVLNNLNTAATNWGRVSALHATLVPLVVDNSGGSQNIAEFKNTAVTKAAIASTGALTLVPTSNQVVLGTTRTVTLTAPTPASASRTVTLPDLSGDYSVVGTEAAQTINGQKTFTDPIIQNDTSNQIVLGVTNTTTISATAPSASRVVTIPDPGGAASFVMTAGNQTIGAVKTFNGGAGGITMDTSTIAMGANKITGLANGSAASDAAAFGQIPVVAAQSDQETGTSTTTFVSPGRQQYHQSAVKVWVMYTSITTTAVSGTASYNVSSLTDNGTGNTTINFTTAFSGTGVYVPVGSCVNSGTAVLTSPEYANFATGSVRMLTYTTAGALTDATQNCCMIAGDQ